jgi:adenylate cyclase
MRVRLQPSGVELEVRSGDRLLDALDEAGLVAFALACRAANCGSCRLRVVTGQAALSPPGPREQKTLAQLGAAGDERLGCQIVLAAESGDEVLLTAART